jgi:hypothetical protein
VAAHHIFVGIVQRKMQKLELRHSLQPLCQLLEQFRQAVMADHQVSYIKKCLIAMDLALGV